MLLFGCAVPTSIRTALPALQTLGRGGACARLQAGSGWHRRAPQLGQCMHAALPLPQVGRKPFNIRESENLQYASLSLQAAPGLKDPRCGPPGGGGVAGPMQAQCSLARRGAAGCSASMAPC